MIRVNLLGSREPMAAPVGGVDFGRGGGEPSEKKGAIAAVLIIGLTIALAAVQYLAATREISRLDADIEQLNQEKIRLQAIIAQVKEYEAKLKLLEEKERLIQQLKQEREGPVRMLDVLSAQLPDFVWLTQLNQTTGSVQIDGMAASYVSIADYIRKLEDSDLFANVELIDARQESEFTSFQLRSQVVTPQAPGAETGAAAPAASR